MSPRPLLALLFPLLMLTGCSSGDDTAEAQQTTSSSTDSKTGSETGSETGSNTDSKPTVPDGLDPGWNEFAPGGETICSRGTPYAYWVRPGTVNRVIIDFIGGGACWDDTTCGLANAIFSPDVTNVRKAVAEGLPSGFYDENNPDNPFKDWYHIVIPYCTGDIHWGNNVITYGEGDNEVTIHHKGAVNTTAVLDWIYDNFSAPEQLLVTGCSAGSYGAAMWSAHIAEHYPQAKVIQFGDSGAGIITSSFFEKSFPSWKAEGVFPTWIEALDPEQHNLLEMALADLYVGVSNHYTEHHFSQYNTAFDENQVFYFQAMGGGDADEWSKQMYASIHEIQDRAPTFSSFIPSGEQHCILPYDNFYTVNIGGVRLVDWLRDMVDGKSVDNLECSDCKTPTP